jgi:3-hydroxybutyryl-CoA dehydrogenase
MYREDEGPIPGLRPQVLALLKPFIDRDQLGMRSNSGFYHYPDPAYQQPGYLTAAPWQSDLSRPLVLTLLGNALAIAAAGVATTEDIDLAWTVGTALHDKPFDILTQMGVTEFKREFARHVAAGRFDPDKARLAMHYLDQH